MGSICRKRLSATAVLTPVGGLCSHSPPPEGWTATAGRGGLLLFVSDGFCLSDCVGAFQTRVWAFVADCVCVLFHGDGVGLPVTPSDQRAAVRRPSGLPRTQGGRCLRAADCHVQPFADFDSPARSLSGLPTAGCIEGRAGTRIGEWLVRRPSMNAAPLGTPLTTFGGSRRGLVGPILAFGGMGPSWGGALRAPEGFGVVVGNCREIRSRNWRDGSSFLGYPAK